MGIGSPPDSSEVRSSRTGTANVSAAIGVSNAAGSVLVVSAVTGAHVMGGSKNTGASSNAGAAVTSSYPGAISDFSETTSGSRFGAEMISDTSETVSGIKSRL